MHLVSDHSQELWCCAQHLADSSPQPADVCNQRGATVFTDGREIYGVQILSTFQVPSKTSQFSFPIHVTTQKTILQIPLKVTCAQD